MATASLGLQLDAWTKKTELRIETVFKESFQRLNDEAQTVEPVGNMRVDTGFLRNSGMAEIGGLPSGPSINTGAPAPEWNISSMIAVLARMKIGQTIFFGWTANYAIHRENFDGFVRLAVQNWPQIVAQVTTETKAALK
jgi:hypothetical protein